MLNFITIRTENVLHEHSIFLSEDAKSFHEPFRLLATIKNVCRKVENYF